MLSIGTGGAFAVAILAAGAAGLALEVALRCLRSKDEPKVTIEQFSSRFFEKTEHTKELSDKAIEQLEDLLNRMDPRDRYSREVKSLFEAINYEVRKDPFNGTEEAFILKIDPKIVEMREKRAIRRREFRALLTKKDLSLKDLNAFLSKEKMINPDGFKGDLESYNFRNGTRFELYYENLHYLARIRRPGWGEM